MSDLTRRVGSDGGPPFAAIDILNPVDSEGYLPANGAVYSNTSLVRALKRTATLTKADVGLEVLHYNSGGWDHHSAMGPIAGTFGGQVANVAASLEAFYLDMRGQESKYVLHAKSLFGWQVAENGSQGAEHGSAGVMMVMGNRVQGGAVYGPWPTCAPSMRIDGGLRVTADYRDVVAEILTAGLGGTDLPHVFQGVNPSPVGIVV